MPRRSKIDQPRRAVARTKELAGLFGRGLDTVDPSRWLRWFTSEPDRAEALQKLVDAGCDQDELGTLLAQLHVINERDTCSESEVRRARNVLAEATQEIRFLASSDLASFLGFVPLPGQVPFEDLLSELEFLVETLDDLPKGFASRKGRVGRRYALAPLVRYVRWATGRRNDELLMPILEVILGEKFSLEVWRRDYSDLWKGNSELEKWWDQLVADGEWPEPKRRQGRRRLH